MLMVIGQVSLGALAVMLQLCVIVGDTAFLWPHGAAGLAHAPHLCPPTSPGFLHGISSQQVLFRQSLASALRKILKKEYLNYN